MHLFMRDYKNTCTLPLQYLLCWYNYICNISSGYVSGAFAFTAVVANILGFVICGSLVKHSADSLANAIWSVLYAVMYAILGFAYDRFLYTGKISTFFHKYFNIDNFHRKKTMRKLTIKFLL